jgi:hypothetical protein
VSPIADNVAWTAGSGTTIATDDVSSVHFQKVKLVDGTADSSAAIPGDATNGLRVYPRPKAAWVQVTSSGLTTATTAYSVGDQMGAQMTFAGAAVDSGGTGVILSAVVLDKADVTTDMRLHLWKASVTLASDNAAFSVSDADMQNYLGFIPVTTTDVGANRVGYLSNVGIGYSCAATSLFVGVETRTAHTFFAAATDLWVALHFLLD